jgi:hypothetical protein
MSILQRTGTEFFRAIIIHRHQTMSIASSKTIVKRARAVLVTGAARRVGRGLALGFAQRGWDVAVH